MGGDSRKKRSRDDHRRSSKQSHRDFGRRGSGSRDDHRRKYRGRRKLRVEQNPQNKLQEQTIDNIERLTTEERFFLDADIATCIPYAKDKEREVEPRYFANGRGLLDCNSPSHNDALTRSFHRVDSGKLSPEYVREHSSPRQNVNTDMLTGAMLMEVHRGQLHARKGELAKESFLGAIARDVRWRHENDHEFNPEDAAKRFVNSCPMLGGKGHSRQYGMELGAEAFKDKKSIEASENFINDNEERKKDKNFMEIRKQEIHTDRDRSRDDDRRRNSGECRHSSKKRGTDRDRSRDDDRRRNSGEYRHSSKKRRTDRDRSRDDDRSRRRRNSGGR